MTAFEQLPKFTLHLIPFQWVPCALLNAIVQAFFATKSFAASSSTDPCHLACVSKSVLRGVIFLIGCSTQLIQYCWRNTCEKTTYKHRGTSSLTPAQVMDQQTYYGYAWTSLVQGMHTFHLVFLHLERYLRLQWFLDWVGNSTCYYSLSIRTKMESIKVCVDKLLFLMCWIFAHGKIALLQAKNLSIYAQRRHQFHPIKHRRLVDISEQDCYTWFSQNQENMHRLMIRLRIPNTITHPLNGAVYTGEVCFHIWLYHMTKGAPLTKMACFVFGKDPRRLSEINDEFISYTYNKIYHKIFL
jgi:hypothetical protein